MIAVPFSAAVASSSSPAKTDVCLELLSDVGAVEKAFHQTIDKTYRETWQNAAIVELYENHYKGFYNNQAVKLFFRLGFRRLANGKIIAPTFSEFLSNYKYLARLKGIPKDDLILPAVILSKMNGRYNPYITKNYVGFYTPGVDPLPVDPDELEFRGTRVSPENVAKMVSAGRYPLFSTGYHDLWHFISFLMYPEYAKRLKQAFAKMPAGATHGHWARLTYLTEQLALADPSKLSQIKKLITIQKVKKNATFEDFYLAIRKLNTRELFAQAKRVASKFDHMLIFYSAGGLEPQERQVTYGRMGRQVYTLVFSFLIAK